MHLPRNACSSRMPRLLICMVVVTSSGMALGADAIDPLTQPGTFQQVAGPVGKLLTLKWSGDALRLNRAPHMDELAVFDEIAAAAGRSGGSSSSSGGDRRSKTFTRSDLHGELILKQPKRVFGVFREAPIVWPMIRVTLREQKPPGRMLVVEQDVQGKLEILVKCDLVNYRLKVRQKPDGSFLVQELRGDKMFAAHEISFLMLCCKHREFVDKNLLPLMKHLGIVPPKTSHNPQVHAAVLARLKPVAEADRKEFRALLKKLDDERFAVRQKATQTLAAQFAKYQSMIRKAANDQSLPREAQVRILQVLKSQRDANSGNIDELISKNQLLGDPLFLVSMLERTTEKKERELLVAALHEQTKQTFGMDVTAWRKWLDSADLPGKKPALEKTNPLAETGMLQNLKEPLGQLLKFTLQQKRLKIDREHWKEPFGGKTIAQLEKEIEEEIVKRGLPRDWFQKNRSEAEHIHVLFYKLCKAAGVNTHSNSRSRSGQGWNSDTHTSGANFETRLVLKQSGLLKLGQPSVRLLVRELNGAKQSVDVLDDGRGKFTMTVSGDASNYLLQLSQQPNGAVLVQEFRGAKVYSAKADSFQGFCEQHSEFAQKTLLPLMKHLGMIPPAI